MLTRQVALYTTVRFAIFIRTAKSIPATLLFAKLVITQIEVAAGLNLIGKRLAMGARGAGSAGTCFDDFAAAQDTNDNVGWFCQRFDRSSVNGFPDDLALRMVRLLR